MACIERLIPDLLPPPKLGHIISNTRSKLDNCFDFVQPGGGDQSTLYQMADVHLWAKHKELLVIIVLPLVQTNDTFFLYKATSLP